MRASIMFGLGLAVLFASNALAQHADIDVSAVTEDGITRLSTGTSDFENPGSPIIPDVRVHPATLNQSGIPGFTNNPGYNAFNGSLPTGALLGFDIVDALRVWDPVEQNFETIPTEQMRVSVFTESRFTPLDGGGFVEGFEFAAISGSGAVHQHISYVLGEPLTPGVYMLSLQLRISTPGIEPTLPFFIVCNHLADPEDFAAALAFVEDSLNSAPDCPGDVNGSGSVDLGDLSIVLNNFGQVTSAGDTNGDGSVNLADLSAVLNAFGQDCP